MGWFFGDREERIRDQKAEAIAASIFWDGGSAKDILAHCDDDELDNLYDQVQAYEAATACVLFW